ncbi:hypothetical protein NESM_000655100 [Novymonas esmeraldas]|uniref:Uncharacterized protein n=1 Tax=Novymonas esmeraldas TaxID=1808958 RepID=A0AAW0EU32_9TRYP
MSSRATAAASDAAAPTRPRAPAVHRVNAESVALQDAAVKAREQRLALEEVMRQERSRRLQSSAAAAAGPTDRQRGGVDHSPRGKAGGRAASQSAVPAQDAAATTAAAVPQTLTEYRRELDKDNGNKEVFRLHYYTSGHLNPADVHFYAVKSRIREYQRHAPSPPPRQSTPHQPSSPTSKTRAEAEAPPAAVAVDGTAEQWTRSALLRMRANRHVLQRIEERERREAAHVGRPLLRETPASVNRPDPPQQPRTSSATSRVDTIASARGNVADVPAPARDVQRSLTAEQSYTAAAPPQRASPPVTFRTESPLRLRGPATSLSTSASLHSPFKPSITYAAPAGAHTYRADTAHRASAPAEWLPTSPWAPLQRRWETQPAPAADGSAYRPIAEQRTGATWESRRTWTELTRRRSPTQAQGRSASLSPAFAVDANAAATSPRVRADVDVSPLTPPPTLNTAPRDLAVGTGVPVPVRSTSAGAPAAPMARGLLEGFRMPPTVLKREDLFQGSS